MIRALWAVLLAAPLILEFWALWNDADGDTLSEVVIPHLQADPLLHVLTLGSWVVFSVWLGWHWWFQYRDMDRY